MVTESDSTDNLLDKGLLKITNQLGEYESS